ncbi:MAG: hypothetical protein ACI9LM_002450 [Alteromonadaceae bacterium]|jgi:hypothetical protein
MVNANSQMDNDIVELCRQIVSDKETSLKEKKALLNEIRKLLPASENRWNFRWVMFGLGLVALSAPLIYIFGNIFCFSSGNIPEGLLALSSTSVGALAAFITSSIKK